MHAVTWQGLEKDTIVTSAPQTLTRTHARAHTHTHTHMNIHTKVERQTKVDLIACRHLLIARRHFAEVEKEAVVTVAALDKPKSILHDFLNKAAFARHLCDVTHS